MTDENGQAVVAIDSAQMGTGTLTLIVTGPDAFPQTFYVNAINSNISFVIVDDYTIDDVLFDDDHKADNGETFSVDIDFKNIGGVQSGNLTATVHGSDAYVACTDSVVTLTAIGAGNVQSVNAFNFMVADSVPDGYLAFFTVDVSDGTDTWSSYIRFELSAPIVELSDNIRIVDDQNLQLDPGETAIVKLELSNVGTSVIENLKVYLSFDDSLVQVTSDAPIITLQPDSSALVEFTVSVDALYDSGLPSNMIVNAIGGINDAYNFTFQHELIIGTMPYIKMQDGTIQICYATFTDSRGPFDYQNNEDKTLTFIPSHAGSFIQVEFSNFDTRDTLYVYNGTSTSDELIGKYMGILDPFTLTGLNADGALTFHFVSNAMTTASGWISLVSCFDPEPLTVTAYASPVFINPGESSTLVSEVTGGNPLDTITYQWTPAETLDDPTLPTPIATPTETTIYVLTVTRGDEQAMTSVLVTLGTGLDEMPNTSLMVYPNPTSSVLNIICNSDDECKYEFINSLGQIIGKGQFVGNTQLSTTNLLRGIYFVRVSTLVNVYTFKVLVE